MDVMPLDRPAVDQGFADEVSVLATADSPRGHLRLSRRGDGPLELRVNGVFAMEDRETTAERALAQLAIGRAESHAAAAVEAGLSVLVGGLGLGGTLAEVLRTPGVGTVTVAE